MRPTSLSTHLLMLAAGLAIGTGITWYQLRPLPPNGFAMPFEPMGDQRVVGTSVIPDLVERVGAAVVNIDTVTRMVHPPVDSSEQDDPFFFRFFGEGTRPPHTFDARGVGSGFLVDPEGIIVTNFHVVRHATSITVTLSDGRKYVGRLVARDPSTDVAVLRIAAHGLPTLTLGNSSGVRVGEWVIAIGSPLGYPRTVTAGIVSALNRDVPINERVNFIQTDAAINPGNSGGPLISMAGRVIGMNTAIAAEAQGIGFAIPVNTVRQVVAALEAHGRVARAWLGVLVSGGAPQGPSTGSGEGVIVQQVEKGSPAEKAGVLAGDRLLAIDGHGLNEPADLVHYVAGREVGQVVDMLVMRHGQRKRIRLLLTAMPDAEAQQLLPEDDE